MKSMTSSAFIFMISIGFSLDAVPVTASSAPTVGPVVPCAVLERFDGDVQILDSARKVLVDTHLNAPVPCGGWISVQKGWARLKHKQGFEFRVGPGSFVSVYDNVADAQLTGREHLVLFKGKIYVEVKPGAHEVHAVTPNSKLKIPAGIALLLYDPMNEESQAITIEKKAWFENRFQANSQVEVKPGEASVLGLKTLRVLPGTPKRVQIPAMKAVLDDLPLEPKEYRVGVQSAMDRKNRLFAADLTRNTGPRKFDRPYERHPASVSDAHAEKAWRLKLVGGNSEGEKVLNPEHRNIKARRSRLEVVDPSKKDSEEKKRLMEELSKIQF